MKRSQYRTANPHWADEIFVTKWSFLAREALKRGLPMPLREPGSGSIEELGCGSFGCVYATTNPRIVFKLTSDPSEAKFVRDAKRIGEFPPGIAKYYAIVSTGMKHEGRVVHAIWREASTLVGMWKFDPRFRSDEELRRLGQEQRDMLEMNREAIDNLWIFRTMALVIRETPTKVRMKATDDMVADWFDYDLSDDLKFIQLQPGRRRVEQSHLTHSDSRNEVPQALRTIHELGLKGKERVAYALAICIIAASHLAQDPYAEDVGKALMFYMRHGVLLADVHPDNVGIIHDSDVPTDWRWAITDPGLMTKIPPMSESVDCFDPDCQEGP